MSDVFELLSYFFAALVVLLISRGCISYQKALYITTNSQTFAPVLQAQPTPFQLPAPRINDVDVHFKDIDGFFTRCYVERKLKSTKYSITHFENLSQAETIYPEKMWDLVKVFHDQVMSDEVEKLLSNNSVTTPNHMMKCDMTRSVFKRAESSESKSQLGLEVWGRALSEYGKQVRENFEYDTNYGFDAAGFVSVDGATFMAVADGVGKSDTTDVASRLAIQLSLVTFTAHPHVPLSKYFELLITRIQNLMRICKLKTATTLVIARVTADVIEIVSIGDSSAIVALKDGSVLSSVPGLHKHNTPYRLSGRSPDHLTLVKYYTVPRRSVSSVILCTDGVTDNLFPADIVHAGRARAIAERATSVFETGITPTPYSDGLRGKRDDVTVAMMNFN